MEFRLICVNNWKPEHAAIQYDFELTGAKPTLHLSDCQIKRKRQQEQCPTECLQGNGKAIRTHSFQIPAYISAEIYTEEKSFVTLKKKGRYGIKSENSGGRVAVVPVSTSKYGSNKKSIPLSEMHVVRDVPEAFMLQHTISTLSTAIDALDDKLALISKKDVARRIRGAVSATLLTDISWRMVDDDRDTCPHKFKNVQIDIDQV
jgi:hypothetical protein